VCYRVLAFRKNGDASPSNADCSIPPAGPTNLTATALDQQTIEIAWTDNSAVEQGYEVERAPAQGGPYGGVAGLAANTTSYRQSGLSTNTTYWYRVRPNADFGYGDYSNVASATPFLAPPNVPSGASATPYYGVAITVTWVDNATNENGFRIERSVDGGATWIALGPVGRDITSIQDYGFQTTERPVCYRVIAFNAAGDSPPSNADCTAQPAPPSNLTAAVSGPAIELTWIDNSALEDGFEVERYGSGVIATLPANATSYRDASASPDVLYGYAVRATKDGGAGGNSNFVQAAVVTAPPAAPSWADAIPSSSTVIIVNWADNSGTEAGFRVERSTDGGATWVASGTAGADETSLYVAGLVSEQALCFRVIAFNAAGDSPPSNTDCATPPAAPSDLVATPTGALGETINLTWADHSGVEDGYEVQRLFDYCDYDGCYVYFATIATLGPNATSYSDSDVLPGNTYTYRVVALKDGGRSDPSNEATVYGQ
jgi:hypothetical protein